MKVRSGFITNSSSVNFIICNISDDNKTVFDFIKETPEILQEWNDYVLNNMFRDDWIKSIPTNRKITVEDLWESNVGNRQIRAKEAICLDMTSDGLEDPIEIILYILNWNGRLEKGCNNTYIYGED